MPRPPRRYADQLASGAPEPSTGLECTVDGSRERPARSSTASWCLGTRRACGAVIDVATGAEGAESLADDAVATEALDELPGAAGRRGGLGRAGSRPRRPPRGYAGTLSRWSTPPRRAARAAPQAEDDGFELAVRSVLDPERSESEPGFFAAFEEFEPELPTSCARRPWPTSASASRETIAALLAPGDRAGAGDRRRLRGPDRGPARADGGRRPPGRPARRARR